MDKKSRFGDAETKDWMKKACSGNGLLEQIEKVGDDAGLF